MEARKKQAGGQLESNKKKKRPKYKTVFLPRIRIACWQLTGPHRFFFLHHLCLTGRDKLIASWWLVFRGQPANKKKNKKNTSLPFFFRPLYEKYI